MSVPNSDSSGLSLDQIHEALEAAWACRRNASQEMLRIARQVLEQPLEDPELAWATLCLGCGLLQQGKFSMAEPKLWRAVHLYSDLADQEGQINSLNTLAIVKARQGHPVAALELFLQIKHLSVTLGDIKGEIRALLNIGATYSSMGDHLNALHHHLLVLELSREHDLPSVERRALNNLSMSYNGMGQHDDALKTALACLNMQVNNENNEPVLDALALRNAGYAHFVLKQFPEAQAMYLKSSELMKRAGDQAEISSLGLLLGRIAQQQGNLKEARHLFEQSLDTSLKIGDEQGQAESLLRLGELLGITGQVENALEAMHRARTLAGQDQLRDKLCEIDLALSELYQQAGQDREALTHLRWHLQLKGELFSVESDQRIQSLRVQFELEQAEHGRRTAQRQNAELSELNTKLGELNSTLEKTNQDLQTAQAQTSELLARLGQHANEDVLTGLPNRRACDAALARVSPTQQVSVVLCDIDHFKAVNDRFSHLVGDEVLRQVAALLRGRVRRKDLLARYGGEEFMVLLTGTIDLVLNQQHIQPT